MSSDLKPCPFCGGPARRYEWLWWKGEPAYAVGCKKGCVSMDSFARKSSATRKWNRRVTDVK